MDNILNPDSLMPDLLRQEGSPQNDDLIRPHQTDLVRGFDFREEIVADEKKIETSLSEDVISTKSSYLLEATSF